LKQSFGAEKPKLNCHPEPEPKLRIAAPAPAPFYYTKKLLQIKIMVAEEVFVKCYNFNPGRQCFGSGSGLDVDTVGPGS